MTAPGGGAAGDPPAPPSRFLKSVAAAWCLAALALLLLLAVRAWALTPFHIATSSMEPALLGRDADHPGDTILVNRLAYLASEPRRWEVVAFRRAGGAEGAEECIVKRIVGLPGETVEIVGGQVHVNGAPAVRPPGSRESRYTRRGPFCETPVRLGKDEYFVLGDNSYLSEDSRRFGPLLRPAIFGRVDWIVLPWERRGRVH